ncbi:MAG: UDP-N-acetylmuramate dehydrogenase [Pseudolabrys sp.]|nr:UDP-N-acetylmuramate dehydrogenase [Pseudolabrys sp.]MSP31250.1 UDP-N-acetylmuramate dehydrogenase [Pseudolabrys sp.]
MSFPDIVPDLKARMPELRGRLLANQKLGEFTWFRVGGPAQAFFMPADEDDLAYFLKNLPAEIPVDVIGAGSNLIVRDGGVPGVVVRLGRGFNDIGTPDNHRVAAGTAMLDVMVARAAQTAGIAGLAFLSGIPGTVGGALRMNGGAYGAETKDVLIEARGLDRQGNARTFSNAEMGFSYRHCSVSGDVIFTAATFQGRAGDPDQIAAEMAEIKGKREASQPRNRTGGSTFKNPPGASAWKLVDEAGCRGLKVGRAQVSELHSNFLINVDGASAADIETVGESVRERVKAHSGIELEWEIKRIGVK